MRDEREIWFIFTHRKEPWGNLRLATFVPTNEPGMNLVIIHNEEPYRTGPRIWKDIVAREGWFKVRKIELPTTDDVRAAEWRES